ncbi:unnamed protein product [Phytomonas sp. EM1]|nr:unnamed protein product [Phytomonas sp. EM1]|eukprot:CCW64173.1 unnamed protein product [Phytomonas sp. isolate EM1]
MLKIDILDILAEVIVCMMMMIPSSSSPVLNHDASNPSSSTSAWGAGDIPTSDDDDAVGLSSKDSNGYTGENPFDAVPPQPWGSLRRYCHTSSSAGTLDTPSATSKTAGLWSQPRLLASSPRDPSRTSSVGSSSSPQPGPLGSHRMPSLVWPSFAGSEGLWGPPSGASPPTVDVEPAAGDSTHLQGAFNQGSFSPFVVRGGGDGDGGWDAWEMSHGSEAVLSCGGGGGGWPQLARKPSLTPSQGGSSSEFVSLFNIRREVNSTLSFDE